MHPEHATTTVRFPEAITINNTNNNNINNSNTNSSNNNSDNNNSNNSNSSNNNSKSNSNNNKNNNNNNSNKFTSCRDAADPSWDGVRGARENKSSRGMVCVARGRVVGGSVSIWDDAGLK